mmetsp:Transcript_6670/g.17364  ORF Transcript_6670/g.17364 Transcript_6670/m.17364 type:complete len:92 (+) Transcript_6670:155-430(+)
MSGMLPIGIGGVHVSSSGHIVGRAIRPRAEAGRMRVVLAVVALVGICVLALGSLGTLKRSEGDHIVIVSSVASHLAELAREQAEPDNRTRR